MIILTLLKNSLLNNLTLKIVSIIMGYSIWMFFSNCYTMHTWITIPICFYNNPGKIVHSDAEYAKIKLCGKRSDLALCKDLALHVNVQSLTQAEQFIIPSPENLFLPSSVSLLYCNPLKISVQS